MPAPLSWGRIAQAAPHAVGADAAATDAFECWPTGSGLRAIKNRVRSRNRSEGASPARGWLTGAALSVRTLPQGGRRLVVARNRLSGLLDYVTSPGVVGLAVARASRTCPLARAKPFTKARCVVHLNLRFPRVYRESAFGNHDAIGCGIPLLRAEARAAARHQIRYATAAIDLGFTIYSLRTALLASTSASDTSYPQRSARCWRTCRASVSCS